MFVYNGIERDYCFEQVLESMLPVCQQIVVIDCYSTDGTYERLQEWQHRHPRIELSQAKWTPNASGVWMRDLADLCRSKLRTTMQLAMQADEVLHPEAFDRIRAHTQAGNSVAFFRYNFRGSARHITPVGRGGGGDWLRRIAPVDVPFHGDGGELDHTGKEICDRQICLYHYTQVRKAEAYVTKSYEMMDAHFGLSHRNDPILAEIREHGMTQLVESKSLSAIPWEELVPFEGQHPPNMVPWLLERGYKP